MENTTFWDSHYIRFIRDLLDRGLRMSPSPINAEEIKFTQNQDLLRKVDDELHRDGKDLISELTLFKQFISIPDAVGFMIDTHRQHGSANDALSILHLIVDDEMTATVADLKTILRESRDMPPGWAASLYAESSLGRDTKPAPKISSGLNLDAMRNFK